MKRGWGRIVDTGRKGLKLIEVMLIVAVIAVVAACSVAAVRVSREAGRRLQCQNNMKVLSLGLLGFANSKNRFPNSGTFYDDPEVHGGDPKKSSIYRAIVDPASFAQNPTVLRHSWVLECTPYVDNDGLYNAWDRDKSYHDTSALPGGPSNVMIATTEIGILRCPDDSTIQPNQGNLSYVVNGGFARWYPIPVSWKGSDQEQQSWNGDVLNWAPEGQRLFVGKKLGVMFPGTHTGDQPWDMSTGPADITDGAAETLLIGENTLVGVSRWNRYSGGLHTNWACPLPNFTTFLGSDDVCQSKTSETDCLAGQLKPTPKGETGQGWSWANHQGSFERVSYGQKFTTEGSFPFANSGHPGGNNFCYCDGSVRFLSTTIDGSVYARLITPAGSALPAQIRQ
jgi:prepilin-type processing-associated H-X9-DG protein